MGALYMLTFPNGKSYIGITTWSVPERFAEHCARARRAKGGYAVHSALRKHGSENVEVKTLVVANDRDFLGSLEINAIKAFGTLSPNGYNLTEGGEGRFDLSDESKRKRSQALKARKASDETRSKISAATKRQMADPLVRAHLSKLAKLRKVSDETRKKISEASRLHHSSAEVRKRISDGTRKAHARPEVKRKVAANAARRWSSEEAKNHHAALIKAKWDDPEWRARTLASREQKRRQGSSNDQTTV